MKILVIDIETAPNVGHHWGLFNQNISLSQLRESSYMLSFAAKWHGQKQVMFRSVFHDGPDAMLKDAHDLLNEADASIHYNGRKFDIPNMNKEFAIADIPPPPPHRQIDLLSVVRKNFRFPSNKLDYVTQALGIPGKVSHTGHDLWVRCMDSDPKAWALMKKYNINDVIITEKLYDKILPWINNHPNRTLYDGGSCPKCASDHVQKRGFYYTDQTKLQRYQCQSCNGWFSGTTRILGVSTKGVTY